MTETKADATVPLAVGTTGACLGIGSFALAAFGAPWPLWFVPAVLGPLLLGAAVIWLSAAILRLYRAS